MKRGGHMDGNLRRQKLLTLLKGSDAPLSASRLAKSFNVSRQIIVGDIALLRAQGETIVANSKGYTLNPYEEGKAYIVAVSHDESQTAEELTTLIDLGVIVVNVMVEHPLYGELVGNLNIRTKKDISDFLELQGSLLSSLTNGVHLHTIICRDSSHYHKVIEALKMRNLLYAN